LTTGAAGEEDQAMEESHIHACLTWSVTTPVGSNSARVCIKSNVAGVLMTIIIAQVSKRHLRQY